MAYDPFAARNYQQQQQPAYHDGADYDPYGQSAPQPHASYDSHPAPYNDEGAQPPQPMASGPAVDKEFDPFQPPPKSTGDLRMWRHDHHGNLWTKGGRGRCIGRFCCCTMMIALLLIVSIFLTLVVFLRPPDIEFSGIQPSATGSAVQATANDLKVNLGIGISVRNPNFFSVTFKSVKVSVTYPINNTQIGGGTENHVVFPSNSKTSFTFPFTFEYSQAADPNAKILNDIVSRCGFLPGSAKRQLSLGYKLTLSIQILFVTIAPPISGTANFDCPFNKADILPLIASIPGLSGALGGSL